MKPPAADDPRAAAEAAPPSLRRRLLTSLVVGFATLGLIVGVGLYFYLQHLLTADFDDALVGRAAVLRPLVEREITFEGESLPLEFDAAAAAAMPEFGVQEGQSYPAEYFAIWDAAGELLAESALLDNVSAGESPFSVDFPDVTRRSLDVTLPGGREGRAALIRAFPRLEVEGEDLATIEVGVDTSGMITIALARSRDTLDRHLLSVALAMIFSWLILAAGAALILWWSLRRGLRPLHDWAGTVERIDPAKTIASDIDPATAPEELRPVAATLTNLLGRIDDVLSRERRFTNDAAHELRTPLAEIRSAAEVALGREGLREQERATLADVADATCEMTALLDMLLSLRRAESGEHELAADADAVEIVRRLVAVAGERGTMLEADLEPGPVPVPGVLFSSAASNLIANATTHAPAGSVVRVRLVTCSSQLRLSVANPAPDLCEGDIRRLAEPFWRKSAARGGGHAGLGLALADACARRLGGWLRFELLDGELIATLAVPFRAEAHAQPASTGLD